MGIAFQVKGMSPEVEQRLADNAAAKTPVDVVFVLPQASFDMEPSVQLPLSGPEAEPGVGRGRGRKRQNIPEPVAQAIHDLHTGQEPQAGVLEAPEPPSTSEASTLPEAPAGETETAPALAPAEVPPPAIIDKVLAREAVAMAKRFVAAGKDPAKIERLMKPMGVRAKRWPDGKFSEEVAVQVAFLRPAPEVDDAIWTPEQVTHLGMIQLKMAGGDMCVYLAPSWIHSHREDADGVTSVRWSDSGGSPLMEAAISEESGAVLEKAIGIYSASLARAGAGYRLTSCDAHPQPHRHNRELCLWGPDRAWRTSL